MFLFTLHVATTMKTVGGKKRRSVNRTRSSGNVRARFRMQVIDFQRLFVATRVLSPKLSQAQDAGSRHAAMNGGIGPS